MSCFALVVFLIAFKTRTISCQTLSQSTSTSQSQTRSAPKAASQTVDAGEQKEENEITDGQFASSPIGGATFASLGLLFLLCILLAIYATRQKLKIIRLEQMLYTQSKQDLDSNPLYNRTSSMPFTQSVRTNEAVGLTVSVPRDPPMQHDNAQTSEQRELAEAIAQVNAELAQQNTEGCSILVNPRGLFDSPLDTHGPHHGPQVQIVSAVNDDVSFGRGIIRKTSSTAASEQLIQFSSSSSEVDTNSRRTTLSRGMQAAALEAQATPPLPRRSQQHQQYAAIQPEEQPKYERMSPTTLESVPTLSTFLAERKPSVLSHGFPHSATLPLQGERTGAGSSDNSLPLTGYGSLPRNFTKAYQPQAKLVFANLDRAASHSLPSVADSLDAGAAHKYSRPSSLIMAAMDAAQMRRNSEQRPNMRKEPSFANGLYGVTMFADSRSQLVKQTTHLSPRRPSRRESGLYSTVHVDTSEQLGLEPLYRVYSEPSLADLK